MHGLASRGLALLFPSLCAGCSSDLPFDQTFPLCGDCRGRIEPGPRLSGLVAHAEVRCGGLFKGPLRDLILDFKYRGRDHLAGPLATIAQRAWDLEAFGPEALVPVPSSWWGTFRRGYHPAEEIARRVSTSGRLPLLNGVLSRRIWSRSQTSLDRSGRSRNARTSFRLRRRLPPAVRRVVLIDDVCTTGATLRACVRLLRRAGAQAVLACTLAYED